jgi:site-specific DNA recombinase
MTPTYSQAHGRRYRYYLCHRAHRRGWASCPSKSVPATEIERFVVDRIRVIGQDPDLVSRTVEEARKQLAARKTDLDAEARQIRHDLEKAHEAMRRGLKAVPGNGRPRRRAPVPDQQETIRALEERLAAVHAEREALGSRGIDAADLRVALRAFDPVWDHLTTPEQARVVQLLVERVDYDRAAGKVAITFRPAGVRTLAEQRVASTGTHP